jgi:hypothetical protein
MTTIGDIRPMDRKVVLTNALATRLGGLHMPYLTVSQFYKYDRIHPAQSYDEHNVYIKILRGWDSPYVEYTASLDMDLDELVATLFVLYRMTPTNKVPEWAYSQGGSR